MKSYIIAIILFLCMISTIYGQQLPYMSQFNTTRALWNPAATAYGTEMQAHALMRQQWLGFSNAPRTGAAIIEYPLLDYNMSGGAALTFDKTGPVSKIGLQLNYAYKLESIFTRNGQLSAGIAAGMSQYTFDPSGSVVNEEDDPLANMARSSTFYPSVSAGLYYISNPKMYDGENVFFCGMSFSQAYAGNVLVNDRDQERYRHIFFEIGTRLFGYDSYFEPSVMLNYTSPDLLYLVLSTKYELRDAFWAGLGYTTSRDLSIQGGIILPNAGSRYSQFRIGALANYALSDQASEFGLGFEALVSYVYDLD